MCAKNDTSDVKRGCPRRESNPFKCGFQIIPDDFYFISPLKQNKTVVWRNLELWFFCLHLSAPRESLISS
jgi:hypothetical protein